MVGLIDVFCEFRSELSEVKEMKSLSQLVFFESEIWLYDVYFVYCDSEVLYGIDIVFLKNCIVVLVGFFGGGKSIVVDFFVVCFELMSGVVLIDGEDLCEFD